MINLIRKVAFAATLFACAHLFSYAQGTRLLRQPSMSDTQLTFVYGADIWVTDHQGQDLKRITSTPAVESSPQFSPDGKWIAFSSNRSGNTAVYVVSSNGGTPKRLTWQPSAAIVRGWTPDGKNVLYASSRETAPSPYNRLWTVPADGGPSTMISHQWGFDGSYSANGRQMALDKMSRWDVEWRAYRGGQNTPLIILNLRDQSETLIPQDGPTTDIHPTWMGNKVYFLSDRDWNMNVWSYDVRSKAVEQVTRFTGTDVKWLNTAPNGQLVIEQDGYIHTVDPTSGNTTQLNIDVVGDFPWAETKWETVTNRATSVSLSTTGKRALMEARGEIFTVPTEFGDPRNLTQSSGAADRRPIWSPNGDKIAWFSDMSGDGYRLYFADQDGLSEPTSFSIGESKLGWEPTWSPDGKHIAFADDDVRIKVINVETGNIQTVDEGGNNLERGNSGLTWAPDSKKLAYTITGDNMFRKVMVWDSQTGETHQMTNDFADAFAPTWDNDQKHFYFLASTNVALGSGWANTSSMMATPSYSPYVIVLQNDQDSPFIPKSDEEKVKETKSDNAEKDEKDKDDKKEEESEEKEDTGIKIDYDDLDRRTIALPLPNANYVSTASGPAGSFFLGERKPGQFSQVLHKFSLDKRKADEFLSGVQTYTLSADGKKMLARVNGRWQVSGTAGPSGKGGKPLRVSLKMKLDRSQEWQQMFEEAWRYERDYFYDPGLHGRDWQAVYDRYAPLIPYVKHRSDFTYILDQINGELSVGHSFVFGGDFPSVDRSTMGMLGADLEIDKNRWKINKIYTTESWNPGLTSPLDRPGIKVSEGNYLVGVNGQELTSAQDPFELLDGTAGEQTVLHLNDKPEFDGAWREVVEPIRNENALRQRAWVENNRRKVEELSNGRLGYIWVPNTAGNGFVNFNRYFFAQQNKEGAVIDERFNGGGLLDDYMVDLMTRSVRAGLTNEVPSAKPMRLPAGLLGPKVLLINERAGSGGDFFPWIFRQRNVGPLIGATTWGGLVKSSVHYSLIDGGALTAPDNAVFDPVKNEYVAENKGVAPDIPVRQDAKSLSQGKDPQLERAVQEVMRMLTNSPSQKIESAPPFPKPTQKGN